MESSSTIKFRPNRFTAYMLCLSRASLVKRYVGDWVLPVIRPLCIYLHVRQALSAAR